MNTKPLIGLLCALLVPSTASAAVGARDTTFNRTGESRLDSGGMDDARAVARQPDGRIVVGGAATGGKAVLYRLTATGAPDQSFGTGGRVTLTTDQKTERVNALALQPDGKIVAAGSTTPVPTDAVVWRRSAVDGSPDVVFNAPPSVRINLGDDELATSVAIDPDGRILVAGNASKNGNAFVSRLTPTLALDPAFHGGTVLLDNGAQEFANVVVRQPDGKIVVAGRTTAGPDAILFRLKDNGDPDLGFNQTGTRTIDSGGDESARDVLIASDGKLVLIGITSVNADGAVYRLNTDGSSDRTFDGDGALGIDSGGNESLSDVLLEPDGNIVAVGSSKQDGIVYRLLGEPHPLTVAKGGTGSGSVVSDPGGIDCGRLCVKAFDVGTQVTLAAVPAAGSTFKGWTGGGCPPEALVCRAELRSAVTTTATFTANPTPTPCLLYTLTLPTIA
jgi:uncharacterized delta-60 repeat protein